MKQQNYLTHSLSALLLLVLALQHDLSSVEAFGYAAAEHEPLVTEEPAAHHKAFGYVVIQAPAPLSTDPEAYAFYSQLVKVQAEIPNLSGRIATLLQAYQTQSQQPTGRKAFGFALAGEQPSQPVSRLSGSSVNIFDKKTFAQYTACLTGSGSSYLSLINRFWKVYGDHAAQLQAKGSSAAAQEVVLKAFAPDSFVLSAYQQMVAEAVTFIQTRIASFSLATFGQSGAQYFLSTELPALDAVVTQAQATFDAHYAGGPDGFPSIKTLSKGADLAAAYKNVLTTYTEQKGSYCAQFALSLAQSLAQTFPPSLALSQPITTILASAFGSPEATALFANLDQFYSQAKAGLALLSQKTPPPAFGVYKNPSEALETLSGWFASFYLYAALVGQNVITAACSKADALQYQNQVGFSLSSQTQSPFFTVMSSTLTAVQAYYQNAAQYYAQQLDAARSVLYAQMASYLSAASSAWTQAETSLASNDFSAAISYYQNAATLFTKGGNTALTSVLNHRADAVALFYYQSLLQSYTQYYQLEIPTFVTQMTTPLSDTISAEQATSWHSSYPGGFVQLFYYDAVDNTTGLTPTFQGMAWLASQAIPVFSHMLNAYQTDSSSAGATIRQYLQQSLEIAQNLVQAAEGMFYNDILAQPQSGQEAAVGRAADANLGSGTVRGVVEGALQYLTIYQYMKKVDNVMAQGAGATGTNQSLQLPFQGLFSGSPVSGFSQFSLLGQLYWSLLNVDPCLELIQQYPQYAQTLVSAAVVLLSQAQGLCAHASLASLLPEGYAAAVTAKLQTVMKTLYGTTSAASLVMAEGEKLLKNAQDALDFEAALACFAALGLQGDATAQKSYFSALSSYAHWYESSSTVAYPALQAAAVYYRAYLAVRKGWSGFSLNPQHLIAIRLQKFSAALTADLTQFTTLLQEGAYDQAIEHMQKFVTLQDTMNTLMVRQIRDQNFFGFSITAVDKFITVQTGRASVEALAQVPPSLRTNQQTGITPVFPLVTHSSCPQLIDPATNLAQLYLAQGTALLDSIKKDFMAGNYASSLQTTYNAVNNSFAEAIDAFGKSNQQEMIVKVQQALTEAAAFAYYSSVIPSKSVTDLLAATVASEPSLSEEFIREAIQKGGTSTDTQEPSTKRAFGFAVGAQPSSSVLSLTASRKTFGFAAAARGVVPARTQPTVASFLSAQPRPSGAPLVPEEQPAYLLRYSEQDLTLSAQQEQQTAPVAQLAQKVKNRVQPAGSSLPVLSYQELLITAQNLLGSQISVSTTPSDTSLVASLVVPLYRLFLTTNGYTSPFSTLDQEVDRYSKQVQQLVTAGMSFGTSSLSTSYTLEKRLMSDGTTHLILITTNGPLQAVPRFQGEYQTAAFYYTQYGQFYAYNPQTVQVGGTSFYQLPDEQFVEQAQAFKGVIGAYLAQMQMYETVVKNIMSNAPAAASLAEKKNITFANYSSVYQQLGNGYSWVLSALSGIQTVQQNQGIFWISSTSFNALNLQQYQNYMIDSAQFLVGSPLSAPYKKVMNDISVLSSLAASYAQDASDQADLLKLVASVYEGAGDLTVAYQESAPTISGYPSPASTNLPLGTLNFNTTYKACALPVQGSAQIPLTYALSWYNYSAGSQFYQQAFKQYKSAFAAVPSSSATIFDDVDFRRAWGNYMQALLRAIIQRLALFGRNAVSVSLKQEGKVTQITVDSNAQFKNVVAQGQTYGGSAAQQGFAALQGGVAVANDSATLQNQYTLMKGLLLDSLIYCSAAEDATQSLASGIATSLATQTTAFLGTLIKCAVAYYAPGMQVLKAQQQTVGAAYEAGTVGANKTEDVDVATSVFALPASDVSLAKLGIPNIKQLVYSNTFVPFMEYCLYGIMGLENDAAGPYSRLTLPENLVALNSFASDLYAVIQDLYAQAFLPQAAQNSPDQLATDIRAAVQAEQQNMVVNAEGYVG